LGVFSIQACYDVSILFLDFCRKIKGIVKSITEGCEFNCECYL